MVAAAAAVAVGFGGLVSSLMKLMGYHGWIIMRLKLDGTRKLLEMKLELAPVVLI